MTRNAVIVTRHSNQKLYEFSSSLLTSFPYPKIKMVNTTATGYIISVLQLPYDYAINIDDDAFVSRPESIEEIIQYMDDHNYDYCGVSDGGNTTIRGHVNPCSMNPFFNVFNLKNIRQKINVKQPMGIHFDPALKERVPARFKTRNDLEWAPYQEEYYPVFFHLLRDCNALFLDATTMTANDDNITSLAYDINERLFLYHTWYSRKYGVAEVRHPNMEDPNNKERIDNVIRIVSEIVKERRA
jgi:hypothetical protein